MARKTANHKQQSRNKDVEMRIEYPLREKGDQAKFWLNLILAPSFITVLISLLFGVFSFDNVTIKYALIISGIHWLVLFIFIILLWIPAWLAIENKSEKLEDTIYILRNLMLIAMVITFFPHELLRHFFSKTVTKSGFWVNVLSVISISVIYVGLAYFNLKRTALRDIQAGKEPRQRKYSERWLWFNSLTYFVILLSVVIIEFWFITTLGNNQLTITPYLIVLEHNAHFLRAVSWLSCAIFASLIFFLWSCLANRLIKEILIPVTFHERDVKGVVYKTYRYLWQFSNAILLKHPFLVLGGGGFTFITLLIPLLFVLAGHLELLDNLIGADQLIWTLGVFIAWFSPIVGAAVHPDETFGEYFNQRLANLLMMVQGHIVILGLGSLGKRVIDREIKQLLEKKTLDNEGITNAHRGRFFRGMLRLRGFFRQKRKYFLDVVTPDVRLEKLCTNLVVIDHDPKDVVYSSENNLLGLYGAVGSNIQTYKSRDLHGNIIHPEKRVLVPIVIGKAEEPFISSRVNLERAVLIISTVPDGESVQTIFDKASRSGVNAIISVSRSDQISYLTYRARHRPIVLVYPKHNQGSTLGHRLWTAILKVRSVYPELIKINQWPRVLVVGNSKSYRFMIQTIWTFLPGSYEQKMKLVEDNFAFIVTSPGEAPGHPELKEKPPNEDPFDMYWPESFLVSGRFPHEISQTGKLIHLNLNTRMVNDADTKAISECINSHKPHILLINHDDFQKTSLMLMRCMRSLEKLKMKGLKSFKLPLILLSASQGDERERYVLGDASRYYDALCKLHNEPLSIDHSYPAHARYDHFSKELIGETISDSLADAEEIIAGARRSFSALENLNIKSFPGEKQFIEITSCLPNIPGSLADYLSRIAGLNFETLTWDNLRKLWQKAQGSRNISTPHGILTPHIPSFQYLRHIKLGDRRQYGFALTGYAALVPVNEKSTIFNQSLQKSSKAVRIFANDGHQYVEKELDPQSMDEKYADPEEQEIREQLSLIPEPGIIGVPAVIDQLVDRIPDRRNTVKEYRQVMLDPVGKDGRAGQYACPGMNLCRIAAFQDYVSACNNLRLANAHESNLEILHARNYHCRPEMQKLARAEEKPTPESAHARIFCCGQGINRPGLIAMVMNTLFFRLKSEQSTFITNENGEWLINIDYFNQITCQNSFFTLNRMFGIFENKKSIPLTLEKPVLPLHLIRILPIGGVASARLWYIYARALHQALHDAGETDFNFYWFDESRKRHKKINNIPEFNEKEPKNYPILINIQRPRRDRESSEVKLCKICGIQDEAYDCKKFRAWI